MMASAGDFAGAEPLLVEAANGMKPPAHLRRRVAEARARVAEFYKAWDAEAPGQGHAAKAAAWGN